MCNLSKISDTAQRATSTDFPVSSQQTTKTTSNCNTNSFGPVCQLWSITFTCMRDGKPQRCVQHHKPLKVTQNAINRDKHINEAFKQIFANTLVKYHTKTCKVSLSTGMFVSMYSHNELLTKFFVFYAKLVKLSRK